MPEVQATADATAAAAAVPAPVTRPRPVLGLARERCLTARQRELLDRLGDLFEDGFAHLTMADIAARLNCSMRTLYALAPSRDELVLIVIDRHLWRIGRNAQNAITATMAPLDALEAYLRAAHEAVARTTQAFARDVDLYPAAQRLQDDHRAYLVAMCRHLLDQAVGRAEMAPVDTAAVARVLGEVGRELARPDVIPALVSSPRESADAIVAVIVRGLRNPQVVPRDQARPPAPGGTVTKEPRPAG
jgi:AcrR family transcriptional regulator